ncbi:MAG: prephenate dehydrogenase/arogenate dehydrogenase family protein [Pedosphaera sp.]|nr:prephenate dehydrogenase/arogenate dehydrogenase family protein [Pedosphaera sp.]
MHWHKVTLIGVGLLGGSLGLALRQRRLASHVEGYVRRTSSVGECQKAGAVDKASGDLSVAVADADLVVFCTPLSQMKTLAQAMLPSLKRGAIVTDVGSVKASVVSDLEPMCSSVGAFFVGSHPMAGAEKMGVSAARADLFQSVTCVLTPTNSSASHAVEQLKTLWQAVGSKVMLLTPEQHDELVSRSSHLVHVIAAALASHVLDPAHGPAQSTLCANGFRDTTRVASGSSEMWRDIALANSNHLQNELTSYIEKLERLRHLLAQGKPDEIQRFFEQAKGLRDQWRAGGASPSPE